MRGCIRAFNEYKLQQAKTKKKKNSKLPFLFFTLFFTFSPTPSPPPSTAGDTLLILGLESMAGGADQRLHPSSRLPPPQLRPPTLKWQNQRTPPPHQIRPLPHSPRPPPTPEKRPPPSSLPRLRPRQETAEPPLVIDAGDRLETVREKLLSRLRHVGPAGDVPDVAATETSLEKPGSGGNGMEESGACVLLAGLGCGCEERKAESRGCGGWRRSGSISEKRCRGSAFPDPAAD